MREEDAQKGERVDERKKGSLKGEMRGNLSLFWKVMESTSDIVLGLNSEKVMVKSVVRYRPPV